MFHLMFRNHQARLQVAIARVTLDDYRRTADVGLGIGVEIFMLRLSRKRFVDEAEKSKIGAEGPKLSNLVRVGYSPTKTSTSPIAGLGRKYR